MDAVEEGLELYNRALGRVSAHARDSVTVAEEALKKSTIESKADVDMTDIDEASRANLLKGWYSEDVLLLSGC